MRYYEGMSRAAVEAGISLQFCMSTPHHILASILLPAVTHARGSYDNHGSVEQNMAPLAFSSLFFDAVGLFTSKDNAQTVRNTRGGTHWNPQLEVVISTLSMGPVGLGDGARANGVVGPNSGTNATVILASCDAHGTILKPSRPAAAIDAMFGRGWNPASCPTCPARSAWPPSGVVMQTHTSLSAVTTSRLLLVIAANQSYELPASQLYPPRGSGDSNFYVRQFGASCANNTDAVSSGCLKPWNSATSTLSLRTGGIQPDRSGKGSFYPWSLLTVYACAPPTLPFEMVRRQQPRRQQQWCILGELEKYVALSPVRFTKLDVAATASFCVQGLANGELVTVTAIDPEGQLRTITVALDNWVDAQAAYTACGVFGG